MQMTSIERVQQTLLRKPTDRIATGCHPWDDTTARWIEEGHLSEGDNPWEALGADMRGGGWWSGIANLDWEEQILEETEDTVLLLDGSGATVRWRRDRTGTPEHVDFKCRDRLSYEEWIKPFITQMDTRRVPYEEYRENRRSAAEDQRFLYWHAIGPFELLAAACGHEHLLLGMADDPEWVAQMAMEYTEFQICHAEELFSKEGRPDGCMFYEDMGFKQRPFMSPAMYAELIQPAHRRLFDFVHSQGCKAIVHSCGFIEPLLPKMVEAGFDCLHAMEVKAGMDVRRIAKQFGDRIALYGGIDARTVISNDREKIDAELKNKIIPVIQSGAAYMLHTDHSEPPDVDFETMQYFFLRGREIATEAMVD